MNKTLKKILIICPIILSISLVANIYKYTTSKNKNNNLIKTTNEYELKINNDNSKKNQIENELKLLKEEKKDKIERYEKWIKWNKEIEDLIN